jgi:hypothetical protein
MKGERRGEVLFSTEGVERRSWPLKNEGSVFGNGLVKAFG